MKDCVSSLCTCNRVHEIHYPRTRPVRLLSRSLLTRTNHPETGGNHIVHRKSGPSHTGFPHHHGNTGQSFPGSGRAIAADAQRRDGTPTGQCILKRHKNTAPVPYQKQQGLHTEPPLL